MKITTEALVEDLKRVANILGHVPSRAEYRKQSKFSYKPFANHFGTWSNAILKTF